MTFTEMISLIIAGISGGVVRSLYFKEPWQGFARNIVAGGITAYYLGPNAPEVFHLFLGSFMSNVEWKGSLELSGFLIGSGGVAIVGWLHDLVQARIGGKDKEKPE